MGLLSYQDDLSKQTATLMESLREYATNFTHKEELLERVAPDRMKQLRAFQQLFTDEIELVRQQLQQEQRQEELVETLRDEELNNEEVKELRSVQDHIDALKHALEQQQRVLHDAADDVAEYQELSRDSVVQGTDEAMRILDRLRRHIVKLQEAVGKERHILDEEEAIVEQLHEQIAEATDFPPIGAVDFPAVDAAKRVATYCDAFGKARIVNLSYIANVPRQAAKQTGLVLYPGCGADMSVLFCFPNCST